MIILLEWLQGVSSFFAVGVSMQFSLKLAQIKCVNSISLDNVTDKGYYIYTEASRKYKSDKAQLNGVPTRAPANGACITFWYYMYGEDMGSLTVYTSETNGVLGPVQFSQSGYTKVKEWKEGEVSIAPDSEFQVSHRVQRPDLLHQLRMPY